MRHWRRDVTLGRRGGLQDPSIAGAPSKHVDPALRLVARGVGRSVLDELRSRYPKSWVSVAARTLGARVNPSEIETRVMRDAHPALKLMLTLWEELFADRLNERERAWALELFATRHAWAHLEAISVRDVLHILDVAELLLIALDAPEAEGARHLTARVMRRRQMRRMVASATVGAVVTLLAFAVALTWLGRDGAQALPSSLAGPWPGQYDDEMVFVANLTQRIPFDHDTMAVRDDVLLVRTRLAVTPGWRHRAIYDLTLLPRSESLPAAEVTLAMPKPLGVSGEPVLVTMAQSLRLRLVPESTRLLDADGRELADLPNPSDRVDVLVHGLQSGRIYYVESRLRAVTPSSGTKGQIAGDAMECRGDRGRAEGPVTSPGSPLLCRIRLLNLGPRTLERVLVRLSYEHSPADDRMGVLTATASAADADPAATDFSAATLLRRGRLRGAEYVPRSARLLTAAQEPIGVFRGNPFRRPLDAGELRVGATLARYLEFAIRLR
jgi:hypothetical protein